MEEKGGGLGLVPSTAAKQSLTRVHAGHTESLKMFLQIPKNRIPGRNGAVTADRLLKAVSSAGFAPPQPTFSLRRKWSRDSATLSGRIEMTERFGRRVKKGD